MTIALLAVAGVAAIVGLVVAVLVIEARAIDRAGDRFDYGLTPDDAPRDDGDWPTPGVTSPAPGVGDYRRLNGDT